MTSKYKFAGLSTEQAGASKAQHGANELPPPEVSTFWDNLFENFEDPLIKILCVALGITLFLAFLGYAEWFEGVGIAAAVFLATFVSTYSEYKNEASFRELQEQASRIRCHVFRDGAVVKLPVTDIVHGDYVLLEAGDKVPADGPVVAGFLHASQASLTGEPEPIRKTPAPDKDKYNPAQRDLSDSHMMFRGSIVEDGEGVMVVDRVGVNTVYGGIMKDINDEEGEERQSPLEVKLSHLADSISHIGYLGASFIFFSFLFKQFVMDQGYSWDRTIAYVLRWEVALHDTVTALILAIIIIVVAVPEGLPMMIAIVLSLNMRKLLDKRVLVRKLLGIETAGSLNILFSDKTGTITHGHLEYHQFISGGLMSYHELTDIPKPLHDLLIFSLKHSTASQVDMKGQVIGGNSSDRAFMAMLPREEVTRVDEGVERVHDIVFSSARKFSATTLAIGKKTAQRLPSTYVGSGHVTVVKGAAETVLDRCKTAYSDNGAVHSLGNLAPLHKEIDMLSTAGVRVIAIATAADSLPEGSQEMPNNLTLVGFVGLRDEVRAEARNAVEILQRAGIQVVMITGDRKETAISIAREITLLPEALRMEEEASDRLLPRNSVLTSDDLRAMSDAELAAVIGEVRVVARALPTDKSRLVRVCQSLNQVVGMTGDGVNDAAALHRADVGFAMGSGTEMAKEAADIVIMDDNVHSLVHAVLYGRTIFRSIRKFIIFQSTINAASTLIVFLGPFLGVDFPLTLIQLLWVNLVMDTLAALAFGGEPALFRYMHAPPIRRDEAIIDPYMWSSIVLNGVFVAALSTFMLVNDQVAAMFVRGSPPQPSVPVFNTAFFAFFIFITVLNAFNVRTKRINIFDSLLENKGFLLVLAVIFAVQVVFTYIGGKVLRTVPLETHEWLWIFSAALVILPYDTLRKLLVAPWLPRAIVDRSGLDDDSDAADGDDSEAAMAKKELERERPKRTPRQSGQPGGDGIAMRTRARTDKNQ